MLIEGVDPSIEALPYSQPGRGENMPVIRRLSYANVVATLALFVALGGTAAAGAQLLFTGANVKDGTLTGADLKAGSLHAANLSRETVRALKGNVGAPGAKGDTGAEGAAGSPGLPGAPGPAGVQGAQGIGITTTIGIGTNVTNYQDLSTLASVALTTPGDYVIFTTFTATNTGSQDEYLNCGYRFAGTINGAAGADTTPGNPTTTTSAGVLNAASAGTAEFVCDGNGNTTYDISNITMRAHYLG